ncbi:hypothetical protein niasHT_014644 [Heterodera trifolii]|uniref:Major sperm protein n=1 Tax=Heterodera trifolii TaxID=157864 RepID=A0ABD2LHX8_9BILA
MLRWRRSIWHIRHTNQQQHFKQCSQRSHIKHPQNQHDKSDNNSNGATLTPEDITTSPTHKVLFNAPFDSLATAWVVLVSDFPAPVWAWCTWHAELTNPGTKRIGYVFKIATKRMGSAFKTTKPKRIKVIPPHGVLGPKKSVYVAITCDAFNPDSEDDRVTVEWTNTPDPAATVFKPEWFQGDGMVRSKNLTIEYNV